MKQILEDLVKCLVDNPDSVHVHEVLGAQTTQFECKVHPNDLGKVIGKEGATAQAFRRLLAAAGMKAKKRYSWEILE